MSVKILFKSNKGTIMVLILLSVVSGLGVSGLLSASKSLSSSGTIKAINVGVYSDLNCTTELSSLNWGILEPGAVITQTVYVKNIGNTNMTLYMTANNWSPANADTYLSLDWDQESTLLTENEVVEAQIEMTVDNAIEGITLFSFQLVIGGTG